MENKRIITPADVVADAYLSKVNYLVDTDREDLIAALIAEYDEHLHAVPAGRHRR